MRERKRERERERERKREREIERDKGLKIWIKRREKFGLQMGRYDASGFREH